MKTEPGKFFQMRVEEKFVSDLDDLRAEYRPMPSRAEMLRMLVEKAVADLVISKKKATK